MLGMNDDTQNLHLESLHTGLLDSWSLKEPQCMHACMVASKLPVSTLCNIRIITPWYVVGSKSLNLDVEEQTKWSANSSYESI